MAEEMWSQMLNRENIEEFYMSTVIMVYSSVNGITKESTRTERAIIKSYLDIYSKRETVAGDRVIYDFGDILLENAKAIVAEYPLPSDITFEERVLDEYTRNSMLEKILSRIDSKSFKMAEFISTDVKKTTKSRQLHKVNELFQVTPLLCFEIIILAGLMWLAAFVAITLPYRHSKLIDEKAIFETNSIQDKYVNALPCYPIKIQLDKSKAEGYTPQETAAPGEETQPGGGDVQANPEETGLGPVIAATTQPAVSATSG